MLKNGLGKSSVNEQAERRWVNGKATGSLSPSVNHFVLTAVFDTISKNQTQVAISNHLHYIYIQVDNHIQYKINSV